MSNDPSKTQVDWTKLRLGNKEIDINEPLIGSELTKFRCQIAQERLNDIIVLINHLRKEDMDIKIRDGYLIVQVKDDGPVSCEFSSKERLFNVECNDSSNIDDPNKNK